MNLIHNVLNMLVCVPKDWLGPKTGIGIRSTVWRKTNRTHTCCISCFLHCFFAIRQSGRKVGWYENTTKRSPFALWIDLGQVEHGKQSDTKPSDKYCQTFFPASRVSCSSGGKVHPCQAFSLNLKERAGWKANTKKIRQNKNSSMISQKLSQLASHARGNANFCGKEWKTFVWQLLK